MAEKSPPMSTCPGAAQMMLREMSAATVRGGAELADAVHVPGQDGFDSGVDVRRFDLFEVLRLVSAAGPSAGRAGMIAQRPPQAMIAVDARQQAIELFDRSARAFAPKLQ